MRGKRFDGPSVVVHGQPAYPQGQPQQYPPAFYPQAPPYAQVQPPQYPQGYTQGQLPQYPQGYASLHPQAAQYGHQAIHVQAPPMPNAGPSQWTSDLCGCCNECFSCCLTCWLPCVAFGQIAQKVDDDQSSCFVNGLIYAVACAVGVPCCYSCLYRHKLRGKFQLPEDPCNDFCTHCCCELCALCQEYRELQNRGIDPTLSSSQPRTIVMMAPGPVTMQH